MRNLLRAGVAPAVVLLVSVAVMAQQPQRGGFMGGFGGPGMLLSNKGVQTELKLTADQVEKIDVGMKKLQGDGQGLREKLQNLSQEERREKMAEMMKTSREATTKLANEVLNDTQKKRLRQIELQQASVQAFMEEDVRKAINLTDDQKEKIKIISDDLNKDLSELRQSAGQNFQEIMTKTPAMRKEALDRVVAILKDDQKTAWKDLTGEPFKFEMQAGQGRFGGKGKGKNKDKDKE